MYSWTSANPHAIIAGVSVSCVASRPGYPVHPVHPCSIYSPSRLIFPVAGLGCAQRPIPGQRPVQRPLVPLILSLGLPLSFPAMRQPVDSGEGEGRDCERLWGGRDARAPGGPSSRNVVAPKVVHRSSCVFVFIRGSSLMTIGCSSSDDPHGSAGARLTRDRIGAALLGDGIAAMR